MVEGGEGSTKTPVVVLLLVVVPTQLVIELDKALDVGTGHLDVDVLLVDYVHELVVEPGRVFRLDLTLPPILLLFYCLDYVDELR